MGNGRIRLLPRGGYARRVAGRLDGMMLGVQFAGLVAMMLRVEVMGSGHVGVVGGLPVSTTHVLSSGVAGTMAANHSGLQAQTLRNLMLAWPLTLPVCIFLGAVLFASGFYIVFNILGLK